MGYKSAWLSPSKSKPRINWKKEIKAERSKVIDEAIQKIRDELRKESMPEAFKRGHYAAITTLEIMKNETT